MCSDWFSRVDQEKREERVCKANVHRGDEYLQLNLQKGFETLEEIEDHPKSQRESLRIFSTRVLDEILAENTL